MRSGLSSHTFDQHEHKGNLTKTITSLGGYLVTHLQCPINKNIAIT